MALFFMYLEGLLEIDLGRLGQHAGGDVGRHIFHHATEFAAVMDHLRGKASPGELALRLPVAGLVRLPVAMDGAGRFCVISEKGAECGNVGHGPDFDQRELDPANFSYVHHLDLLSFVVAMRVILPA